MTSTTKKSVTVILAVLMFSVVAFIFYNSSKDAETSSEYSGHIVKFTVEKVLMRDYEAQSVDFLNVVTHIVRKLAHFSEFALLSLLTYIILKINGIRQLFTNVIPVVFTFFIGCIDEFIQIFSAGRACRFSDVLIDTAGGIFAVVCLSMLFSFIKYLRVMRGENEKIYDC